MMSSPFTSKLGTNYCPPDDEIAEIENLLAEPEVRLKCLDDEIASLQRSIDELEDERIRLRAYVEAHRALISPIRRLPLDIIEEIFIACLPTHRNCVMSAMEAPVILGRICSWWRAISLSTPRLWSRLHIVEPACPRNNPAIFEPMLVQRFEATRTWLSRSGNCPLSISLKCNYDQAGLTSTTPTHLIQALLPFAPRWEHITFSTFYSVLESMSHLVEADVPMLKSIGIMQATPGLAVPWESLGFLRAPAIHSFSIAGSSFRPLELPLSWERLTDLSILEGWGSANRSLTSEMSLHLLASCPQLRICRLIVHTGPEISTTHREPVLELSFLHTLDLQCVGPLSTTFCQIFPRLLFPQLRHLKLRGNIKSVYVPETVYPGSVFRAAPRVQTIDINLQSFSKASLAHFLRGLPPTLRELNIGDTQSPGGFHGFEKLLDDEILELLIPSPACPAPGFPNLQVLEIKHGCVFSDAAVLRFIKLRMLKRVTIAFERDMQLDILAELEPLVQNGLHLELTYHPPEVCRFSPWQGLTDVSTLFQSH
ncbi:hypothetical protein B0H17DRAFT_1066199 [Mycena rosella]|uniref:F-box domain-containing protein n=1 Tax=Mycena rosella TaxID=1033263 RepID=A0AAD7DG98_MYCRO|nr:hypothetical protein B0H17DRAFT_1066199 [Mycena rosella]